MTESEIRRHLVEHAEALELAQRLGRLADQGSLEGVDVNVVDGVVMMSPTSLEHFETCADVTAQLHAQVRGIGCRLAGDVRFAHPAWSEDLYPDLAVWEPPEGELPKPLDAEAILLAIEVVSVSSVENDYVIKDAAYRQAGIPAYLLLDPYTRTWRLHTEPGGAEWGRIATGKYDEQITVPLPAGESLELDTLTFPQTPSSARRDRWPAHRTTLAED